MVRTIQHPAMFCTTWLELVSYHTASYIEYVLRYDLLNVVLFFTKNFGDFEKILSKLRISLMTVFQPPSSCCVYRAASLISQTDFLTGKY